VFDWKKRTWFMVENIKLSTMPALIYKKEITYAHPIKP